jgi:hypothetical protein
MNLHVSTPLAAESAKRSRQFHQKIAAIHRQRTEKGLDPAPYWSGMWMWDLVVLTPKSRIVSIDRIISVVCERTRVSQPELLSPSRHAQAVRARQIAFYLARKYTRLSFGRIGARINRDHSTALYAFWKLNKMLETDADLGREIDWYKGAL